MADSFEIFSKIHDKSGKTIWILTPTEKLKKTDFERIKEKIIKAHGYYSRFVSGFVFNYDPSDLDWVQEMVGGKLPESIKQADPLTYRKLDFKKLYETKKKPRKDIIIKEIEAGKMEYAVHRKFDGMTDSYDYYNVTNKDFSPAETNKYLVDELTRAKGQSHWVYSASMYYDDLLGYYINFTDYYIRYKKEKEKPEVIPEAKPEGLLPDSDFDPEQLEAGIKVEMEHTDNPDVAKQIAKGHLSEDKDYYRKLEIMEKSSLEEMKAIEKPQEEKNSNFIKTDSDEISERIPQEDNAGKDRSDQRMAEIASRLENGLTKAEKAGTVSQRDGESRIALEYALENGLWIENIYSLGDPFSTGHESTNAVNAESGIVYKSNNLINTGSISNLFKQIRAHNEYFPDTAYELIGFTGIKNDESSRPPFVEVVFSQPLIDDSEPATPKEIEIFMSSIGFSKIGEASYSNGEHIISDLHPRNVLKDQAGRFYIVDDIINPVETVTEIQDAEHLELNPPIIETEKSTIMDKEAIEKQITELKRQLKSDKEIKEAKWMNDSYYAKISALNDNAAAFSGEEYTRMKDEIDQMRKPYQDIISKQNQIKQEIKELEKQLTDTDLTKAEDISSPEPEVKTEPETESEPVDVTQYKTRIEQQREAKEEERKNQPAQDDWARIPESFKFAVPVKEMKFDLKPDDPNIGKLFDPIVEDVDTLRPILMAVKFDTEGAVASNAHILAYVHDDSKGKPGIYCITKTCQKESAFGKGLVKDQTYPKIEGVIPKDYDFIYKINLLSLKTYCETIERAKIPNEHSNMIAGCYNDQQSVIGFKTSYMIKVCTFLMQLGHTTAIIRLQTAEKAMVFIEDVPEAYKKDFNPLLHDFCLLMPMMLNDSGVADYKIGDIDYSRLYNLLYDFQTDSVLTMNGQKQYKINTSLAKDAALATLPVVPEMLNFLYGITKQKYSIPICNSAYCDGTWLKVTNLEIFARCLVSDKLGKGYYRIEKYGLLYHESLNDLDPTGQDFPIPPIEQKGWETKGIALYNSEEMAKLISQMNQFVSDDELRPVMNGIHLVVDPLEQSSTLSATNASILLIRTIGTDISEVYANHDTILGSRELLGKWFNSIPTSPVSMLAISESKPNSHFIHDVFTNNEYEISIYAIKGNFPVVERVIPDKQNRQFTVNRSELMALAAGIKPKEKKGYAAIGLKPGKGQLSIIELQRERENGEDIQEKELTTIQADIQPVADYTNKKNIALIMPTSNKEGYFFDVQLMISALKAVDDKKVTLLVSDDYGRCMCIEPNGGWKIGRGYEKPVKPIQQPEPIENPENIESDILQKFKESETDPSQLIRDAFNQKLSQLPGWVFNESSGKYNYKLDDGFIVAYYDWINKKYHVGGNIKFITPLGANAVGLNLDFDTETEIMEYLDEQIKKNTKQPEPVKTDAENIDLIEEEAEKVFIGSDGTKYWAEKNKVPGSEVESWSVVSQFGDYPATEAYSEWFANKADADQIAEMLSEGKDPDAADESQPHEPKYETLPSKELIREENGLKIYLVDGESVRIDHIKYVAGGNGYAYDWIPKDEVWIDENQKDKPNDMEGTILHELYEIELMKEGMSYDEAHELADAKESEFRKAKGIEKEPWKMTKAEWRDRKWNKLSKKVQKSIQSNEVSFVSIDEIWEQSDNEHNRIIQQAISEGKPVPPEVLADYPDLKPQLSLDITKPVKLRNPQPGEEYMIYKVVNWNENTLRAIIEVVTSKMAIPPQETVSINELVNTEMPADPMGIVVDIDIAKELGELAFLADKKRVPALDPALDELLGRHPNDVKPYLEAWLQGWDNSNLSAPVPEPETKPKGKLTSMDQIPAIVRQFMPVHQQRALVSMRTEEHWDTFEKLKTQIESLPKLYGTEGIKKEDKIVYLHYFYGGSDWFILEGNKEELFGYVILNGDYEMSELGYIGVNELIQSGKVELDFYWTPIPLQQALFEAAPSYFENPKMSDIAPEDMAEMKGISEPEEVEESETEMTQPEINKFANNLLKPILEGTDSRTTKVLIASALSVSLHQANFHQQANLADKILNNEGYEIDPSLNSLKDAAYKIAAKCGWDFYSIIAAYRFVIQMNIGGTFAEKLQMLEADFDKEIAGEEAVNQEPEKEAESEKGENCWGANAPGCDELTFNNRTERDNWIDRFADYTKTPISNMQIVTKGGLKYFWINHNQWEKSKDFVPIIYQLESKIDEPDKSITAIPLNFADYKDPYQVNKAIEKLLHSKAVNSTFTPEEKNFMTGFTGYGGLDKYATKYGEKLTEGTFNEYYTPDSIVLKMWGLAYKYGFIDGGKILETSAGIGAFLKYAPNQADNVTAIEMNPISARILAILYPNATVKNQKFERVFIKNNESVKGKTAKFMFDPNYDLVIGNPPYGDWQGFEKGMGEWTYTKADNIVEYFIIRGLDMLKSGGLLIYIVGAEPSSGGKTFLQSGLTKGKEKIAERAELIDAYRLPNDVFERTGVTSEIVVFRKK